MKRGKRGSGRRMGDQGVAPITPEARVDTSFCFKMVASFVRTGRRTTTEDKRPSEREREKNLIRPWFHALLSFSMQVNSNAHYVMTIVVTYTSIHTYNWRPRSVSP